MIVVIDGPAGAGKSTVARALARRLGAAYLDTGAMYRALAWLGRRRGISPGDAQALSELAATAPVSIVPVGDGDRVLADGTDVTAAIREPEVSTVVSQVSAHAGVRAAMVDAQRRLVAAGGDWVADGRDLGTVVWPQADLKVFLVADDRERARRRCAELQTRGQDCTLEQVLADMRRRDRLDSTRQESPLRAASDAHTIDTSELAPDEVVRRIASLVARGGG